MSNNRLNISIEPIFLKRVNPIDYYYIDSRRSVARCAAARELRGVVSRGGGDKIANRVDPNGQTREGRRRCHLCALREFHRSHLLLSQVEFGVETF